MKEKNLRFDATKMKHPLFVFIGPSGGGKTFLTRHIHLPEVVSFTTRGIRKGEIHGQDYYFFTPEHIEKLKEKDELAEWNVYLGNTYGITKEELFQKSKVGPCYWIAEVEGLRTVRTFHPHVVSIYIYTDREQTLQQLKERESNKKTIEERIQEYEESLTWMKECDYVIVNRYGDVENAVARIHRIINAECKK